MSVAWTVSGSSDDDDYLKETNALLRVGDAGGVVEVAEILLEGRSHSERR